MCLCLDGGRLSYRRDELSSKKTRVAELTERAECSDKAQAVLNDLLESTEADLTHAKSALAEKKEKETVLNLRCV